MRNALRYKYLLLILLCIFFSSHNAHSQQVRHRYITVCQGTSGNYTYMGVDGTGDTLFFENFESGIGSCWYTNKTNNCINNFEAKNRIYLWDRSNGTQSQTAYQGRSAFAESVDPYSRCNWVNGYIAYLATPQIKIDIPAQTKITLYYYNEAFTQEDWYYGYNVYYDEFGILYYNATSTPVARNFYLNSSGALYFNGSGPIAYLYQERRDTDRWTRLERSLNALQAGYNIFTFGHKDLSAVGCGIDNVLVRGPRLIPIPTEVSNGAPGFTFTTTETYDNTFGCTSEIAYYHWTVAGPTTSDETVHTLPYTWRNGQTYTAPGDYEWHGTNRAGCDSTAYLHISVTHTPDQPDNIEPVNCSAQPLGSLWTIQSQWSSDGLIVSNLVTPLVGDLDGDGKPEIVCFGVTGQNTSTPNRVRELLVFDGTTHRLKAQIALTAYVSAFAATPYGLVREGGKGLIVVAHDDGYLRAYDFTAATPLVWTSNQMFSAGNDKYTTVAFADLDNDGHAEVIARNKVFDVATGNHLATATGGSNLGASFAHQGNSTAPLRQKISMACVANIDASDDVMEVILGNEIYKPVLTAGRISALQLWLTAPSLPAGVSESDGHAQVADFNLDGHLDIFISNRYEANHNYPNSGTVSFYVWDVANNSVSNATAFTTSSVGKSLPLIANIDSDPNLEIVIQSAARNGISTYKYDYVNRRFNFVWDIGVTEDSYSNGVTCFDFDQDGEMELLICDERTMKIVDGSGNTKSTLPYAEVTIMQYPVIADVDSDGHAEIISVGNPSGNATMNGKLNIFRSAGAQWPPARPVWNQYLYNVTNVNRDLTLPRYLFNNATSYTDPDDATVIHRPFNNFLQQATTIDEHGRPFNPVADIAVSNATATLTNDDYAVTVSYSNAGDLPITAPYKITFYQDNYRGTVMQSISVSTPLAIGASTSETHHFSRIDLCSRAISQIVVAVNDAGSGIAQHGGQQGECDTLNNTWTIPFDMQCSDTTYETINACDSLRWHGTTYFANGVYYFDTVGRGGTDSVAGLYLVLGHTSPTNVINDTACDQYYYGAIDSSFTNTTTFDSLYVNASGCDSLVTLILIINRSKTTTDVHTACDSITWIDGNIYNTTTNTPYLTLQTSQGCDSIITLDLTIAYGSVTTTDTTVCDVFVWPYNGTTYTVGGTYSDTIVNSDGCDVINLLHLALYTTPILSVSADTTIISCSPATLRASGADFYRWTPSNTLSDSSNIGSTSTITATPTATTTYTVHGYSLDTLQQPQCGCTADITVHVATDTTTTTACDSYTWHLNSDTVITTSGRYASHATTASGCDSSVALDITIHPSHSFTTDTNLCDSLLWLVNDSLYTTSTSDVVRHQNTYGCDSNYTLNLTIRHSSHAAVETVGICHYYEWRINGHDSTFTASGIYYDTLTNHSGCDSLRTLDLTIHDCPIDTPDVVQDPQCYVQPPASAFDMQELYRVPGANSGTTPFVGDVDGDGIPDIVVCGTPIASRYGDDLIVIDGRNGTQKYHIPTETYRFSGQLMTIIDADANGIAELYLLAEDHYLYCYDIRGTGTLWRSNIQIDRRYIIMAADINADGRPEIVCGPYIFDAQTGTLLLQGTLQSTGMGYGAPNSNWTPANTPIVNRYTGSITYPNVGAPYKYYMQALTDIDRDGHLELCAGNTIYKPVINNTSGTAGNTWSILRQTEANSNIQGWDGQTFIADFDGDGDEDVCVLGFRADNRTDLYVWNGQTSTIIGYYNVVMTGGYPYYPYNANSGQTPSIPFCGDLDGNGTPEIIFNHPDAMRTFTFDASQPNKIRLMHNASALGETGGFAVFDFNQDGRNEIIYRTETQLGIVDGVTLADITTPITCHSGTVSEYPIVADVNGDGHAEIIVTANDTLFNNQRVPYSGDLRVYGSRQAGAWGSARTVWNQFNYNSVNINEDLTVPSHQFNIATRFPNGTEPFNSFLRQTPTLNRNGDIFMTAPDVFVSEDSTAINYNNSGISVSVKYCNQGETPFFAPHRVTVYGGEYRDNALVTNTASRTLEPGQCNTMRLFIARRVLCQLHTDSITVSANDGGWGIAQNGGQQTECDTVNNSLRLALRPFVPDGDTIAVTSCDSYTWHTDHDTVILHSGIYIDTVTDRDGCDSVPAINLSIRHSSDTTLNYTSCDSFFWDATRHTYRTSAYATAHLANDAGCDSTLTLHLTMRYSSIAPTDSAEACDIYLWFIDHSMHTSSGIYQHHTTNAAGCDSLQTLDLYIAPSPSLSLSPDTSIFTCGMATLHATGGDLYMWSPAASLSDSLVLDSVSSVSARPEATQTYTVTSFRLGRNRIFNGDFSLGNTGFFTDLSFINHDHQYGEYELVYDAAGNLGLGGRDHTTPNDTAGRFFLADGMLTANGTTWGQRISVEPNSTYIFSMWTTSLSTQNHAELQVYINGAEAGPEVYMTDSASADGVWMQHFFLWNSGDTSKANIRILNHNILGIGNDFGIDDISFNKILCSDTRTVTVHVGIDTADAVSCDTYTWQAANDRQLDSSGIYLDTVVTSRACDSTIALRLSMHYSDTSHIAADTCDTYTWQQTSRTHTISTTDTAILATSFGCDSIVVLHLTIRNSSPVSITRDTVCDHYTWSYDNTEYQQDTTVTRRNVNAVGCDSISVLLLKVNHRTFHTETFRGCDSYVWPIDGQTYTRSEKYIDTVPDRNGCDSIVTLVLSIYHSDRDTIIDTICDNYYYSFNGRQLNISDTYIQRLTNRDQCDSITILFLTVLPTHEFNIYDTVKEENLPYIAPDGSTYMYPAVDEKMMMHTKIGHCDSIIHLNLTVLYLIDYCDKTLLFPNLVTPNGDGHNDIFSIVGLDNNCWPHNELRIYNRWGALVHKSVNLKTSDDGWNPANMPAGTYYFLFQGSNPQNTIEHKGVIEVIKD